jgi:hypothetical protein
MYFESGNKLECCTIFTVIVLIRTELEIAPQGPCLRILFRAGSWEGIPIHAKRESLVDLQCTRAALSSLYAAGNLVTSAGSNAPTGLGKKHVSLAIFRDDSVERAEEASKGTILMPRAFGSNMCQHCVSCAFGPSNRTAAFNGC